jgi:hypothetical protein
MRDMSELHKSKPPPSGSHHAKKKKKIKKKKKKNGTIFLCCGHVIVEKRGVMGLLFISVNYRNPMPEIDRLMQVRLYVNSCTVYLLRCAYLYLTLTRTTPRVKGHEYNKARTRIISNSA